MVPISDHCLKAPALTLCLLPYLGQQYLMRFDSSKRPSASKKKNGHILTLDNRCCHSKPIIVSIMKSVVQKRGALSFPYAGPCVLYIPLFIRSWLLITVPFASESRMPYNLPHPKKDPQPFPCKWSDLKRAGTVFSYLWATVTYSVGCVKVEGGSNLQGRATRQRPYQAGLLSYCSHRNLYLA